MMHRLLAFDPALMVSTTKASKATVALSAMRNCAELEAQPLPLEVTLLRSAFASGGARARMCLAMPWWEVNVVGKAVARVARREMMIVDFMVWIVVGVDLLGKEKRLSVFGSRFRRMMSVGSGGRFRGYISPLSLTVKPRVPGAYKASFGGEKYGVRVVKCCLHI